MFPWSSAFFSSVLLLCNSIDTVQCKFYIIKNALWNMTRFSMATQSTQIQDIIDLLTTQNKTKLPICSWTFLSKCIKFVCVNSFKIRWLVFGGFREHREKWRKPVCLLFKEHKRAIRFYAIFGRHTSWTMLFYVFRWNILHAAHAAAFVRTLVFSKDSLQNHHIRYCRRAQNYTVCLFFQWKHKGAAQIASCNRQHTYACGNKNALHLSLESFKVVSYFK